LLRRGGGDEEGELAPLHAPLEELDEGGDVPPEVHAPAGLDEVLPSDAPELRVVPDQVSELRPLLDEVDPRQARDLLLERGSADELAEDQSGVVQAERLVDVG